MSIKYLENLSDNWVPMPDVAIAEPADPRYARNGVMPYGPAPVRTRGSTRPPEHELRPRERLYYIDGDIPAPPPPSDPKWDTVRKWLLCTVNNGTSPVDPALDGFNADVWTGADGGATHCSSGDWSRNWLTNYWSPPWAAACPEYRRVGWQPWANGHSGSDHYLRAMHCLEQFVVSGFTDDYAWKLFVLSSLHTAGQGLVAGKGECRYEKSSWAFAGDNQRTGQWSHSWPECVWFLWYLLADKAPLNPVIGELISNARHNPHNWTGYWGIRGTAWYIRAVRAIGAVTPNSIKEDDARIALVIDQALAQVEQRGNTWFHNDGAYNGTIDVWQDGLFCSEAVQWGILSPDGDRDVYQRVLPIAQWHIANNRAPDGKMAYYTTPATGPRYISHTHTSCWLPMMAAMVRFGDLDQSEFVKSAEVVIRALPNETGFRGLLWHNAQNQQTRPWGPAASKIAALGQYGLRRDLLIDVGGYGG